MKKGKIYKSSQVWWRGIVVPIITPFVWARECIAYDLHILSKRNREVKRCTVSLSERYYKVITDYQVWGGCIESHAPVYILPSSADVGELSRAIFSSLQVSKVIRKSRLKSNAEYLALIKEKSLKDYYTSANFCSVQYDPVRQEIEICPIVYSSQYRSLVGCPEKAVTRPYTTGEEEAITGQIVEILQMGDNGIIETKGDEW